MAPRCQDWLFRRLSAAYFNELLIEENLLLSLVPSPFTIAMIASEMPTAISPYSMAVAPDSSLRNLYSIFIPRKMRTKN